MKSLRIVSWNCQGAFRNKYKKVLELNPDILIIQECESLEKLKIHLPEEILNGAIRIEESQNKGLAVFSSSTLNVKLHKEYLPVFKHVAPIYIESLDLNLFAIWAMNDKENPKNRYIGQIWNST